MRVCEQEIAGYRAWNLLVSGGLASISGFLFSHRMPRVTRYSSMASFIPYATSHTGVQTLLGRGIRGHRRSWDIRIVLG